MLLYASVYTTTYCDLLRRLLREILGTKRYIKSRYNYRQSSHPVFSSDINPATAISRNPGESFSSFFLRVETSRKTTTHALSKNVQNSLSFYKAALYLIPLLEKHCNLSTKSRVLDYGSGGLRNGYGLLEYLDADCYSCADITTEFLDLALKNSPVLDHLSTAKGLTFYNLHSDPIPANYFDIVVSTYVLPHIPPEQLDSYFSDISSSLSGNGLAYLDFIPALKLLKLNSTTYLYPYRYILPILKKHDLKIVGEYGFSLILAQA